MANGRYWMQKAFGNPRTKGALHRQLGVPQGQKIPLEQLRAAAKKKGKLGRRARAALIARRIMEGR